MTFLESVSIQLPHDLEFSLQLFSLLKECGVVEQSKFQPTPTNPKFIPRLSVEFVNVKAPAIVFTDSVGNESFVPIRNETNEERESPHSYKQLPFQEVLERIKKLGVVAAIDHLGVNFPWFNGVSPIVNDLRKKLSPISSYYRFPTGEDWDFILPATQEELNSGAIDLSVERRPKLELVSFEKSSTPIIQIDCITTIDYEKLADCFPEGIKSEELRNVWVYIKNPFNIDVCLVLNEPRDSDWSGFFEGHRLVS
jgi:hypothetical protein